MVAYDARDNHFTGDYAADFAYWSSSYDSETEIRLLRQYNSFDDDVFIEMGCGTGRVTFKFADWHKDVVAVDDNPSLIRFCQRKLVEEHPGLLDSLRFEVQDACNVPYPDGYFDGIVDAWTFTTLAQACNRPETEYARLIGDDAPVLLFVERDSEFQNVLSDFTPDGYSYDPQSVIENSIQRQLGPPIRSEPISARYTFPSVPTAVNAFVFMLQGWMDIVMTTEDRDSLYPLVEAHAAGGTVTFEENATFYEFRS